MLAVMLRGAGFRFVHSVFITSARRIKYAFDKHLFATNVTISLTLSGMGDILQQHHNIIKQQQHSWDRARTCHMTCTGVTVGTLCHHWYLLLDRCLPGRSLAVVLQKLVVDQLLFSPVWIAVLLVSLELFQGNDWNAISSDVWHKGWCLYTAGLLINSPAQLVNFYLLPTKFRILYDNSVSLMFDVYTSHVCYNSNIVENN